MHLEGLRREEKGTAQGGGPWRCPHLGEEHEWGPGEEQPGGSRQWVP